MCISQLKGEELQLQTGEVSLPEIDESLFCGGLLFGVHHNSAWRAPPPEDSSVPALSVTAHTEDRQKINTNLHRIDCTMLHNRGWVTVKSKFIGHTGYNLHLLYIYVWTCHH